MVQEFRNPILPGLYTDASVCRVGNDFYLVTSSLEYFPGIPIFHSRDLVHWCQLGHVVDHRSKVNLDRVPSSGGLWGPTIRHHAGVFYVASTLVKDFATSRHNFIVTATDPNGPWSDPVWLEDAPGNDPSLFFDEDGRVWYTGNRIPATGERYPKHREIWLQELDPATLQLVGEKYTLWDGALKNAVAVEAPHLYKVGGYYYLMASEGGTEFNHAITMARSLSVTGPYLSDPHNPIMTHRHLGNNYPITNVGHADLAQTPKGDWWIVMLAARPYGGYFYNLGRETFLAPVRWEDDWLVISPGSGRIEFEYPVPDLPAQFWQPQPACDHFDSTTLALSWNFVRTPRESFWSLTEKPGYLRLKLGPVSCADKTTPCFIGRRQSAIDFSARTVMHFEPQTENECAGVVLRQSEDFHFRFVRTQNQGQSVIRLVRRARGNEETLAEQRVAPGKSYLQVQARGQTYSFYFGAEPETWHALAEQVDGRILSPSVAGGWVGTYIGLYASSQGQPSNNSADFDWFEYQTL